MALAVIALCAISPAAAAAAKGKSKPKAVSAPATATITGSTATGSAIATCPRGTVSMGGGYSVDASSGENLLLPFESIKVGKRGWLVSATQIFPGTGVLTAVAYCRPSFKLKQVLTTTTIGAPLRSQATALTSCPKGWSVISGGFEVPPHAPAGSFVYLTDNERTGFRGWSVTAVRSGVDGTAAGPVSSYAYCAKKRVLARTASASAVGNPPSLVTATATTSRCPKGGRVSGGGFRAPYVDLPSGRNIVLVNESRLFGSGWRASGILVAGAGTTVTLDSLGYCAAL